MLKLKLIKKEPLKLKVTSSFPPIIPANFQDKEVIPSIETQTITPDRGFDGLSEVKVLGDEDLQATNIKKGVEIFGVNGSVEEMTQETKEGIDNQDEIITNQEITIDNINQIIEQKVLKKEKYKPRYIYTQLFYNYTGTELDYEVANIDVSNLTKLNSTFYSCKNLQELNLSSWNVSNVIYMSELFRVCISLTKLNLSGWDTSNVVDMSSMFNDCRALSNLDVKSFDTSNVKDMSHMFQSCRALIELDLSNFNTSNVTDMGYMFNFCLKLTKLDIRNFDFTKVTSYSNMFGSVKTSGVPDDCLIIVKDENAKNWITSKFSRLTNVKTMAELEE